MFTFNNVLNALRSGGTQRYHTHAARMLKTQDVAQHSYNVALLAYMLSRGTADSAVILHALCHDSGEHWVGDVPAPTKRSLGIREKLGDEEDRVITEMLGLQLPPLSYPQGLRLKLCDSLEGALYCCTEINMGNKTMIGVLQNFVDYVDELTANHADTLADGPTFDYPLFVNLIEYARSFLKETP